MHKKKFQIILFLFIFSFFGCKENNLEYQNPEIISYFDTYKEIIKEVSRVNSQGLGDVCKLYYNNANSEKEFLQVFIDRIRLLNDTSVYFYIYDKNFVNIAHPVLKHYIGKDHSTDKDSRGHVIREKIEPILNNPGEGFVDFYFVNPATKIDELKTSYVTFLRETDYWCGLGFYGSSLKDRYYYKDDVNKLIIQNAVSAAARGLGDVFSTMITDKNEQKKLIRNYCDNSRFLSDNSGYFFVNDMDGISISYPVRKDLEGTDLKIISDINGVFPVVEALKVINSSQQGFIEYHLENPSTKVIQKKIVYIEKIPNSDYYIGCGYYEN